MGGINQIRKEVVTFHNLFKMGLSRDIKRLSLILTWKSESMVARILKSSVDTNMITKKHMVFYCCRLFGL